MIKKIIAAALLLILAWASPVQASAGSELAMTHSIEDGLTFGGNTAGPLANRFTGAEGGTISGLNSHRLGYYDAFCTDPLLDAGSGYLLAGSAENAQTDYWGAMSEADRRYLAALIQFYCDHPYCYDANPAHGKSENWVAKMGTQLAVFEFVLTEETRGAISRVMDDAAWYDVKGYCALARQWAAGQTEAAPEPEAAMPSFDGAEILLLYNPDTGLYEGTATDFNGALVTEGFDFSGSFGPVTVVQSGNNLFLSAGPEEAAAAGLSEQDNGWRAEAAVTKRAESSVNMGAVKLYASPQNHYGTQQLLIYDPSEEPVCAERTFTAAIRVRTGKTGFLRIEKSSAEPDLTGGNRCYSLEGAVYGLYKSREAAETGDMPEQMLETDGQGRTPDLPLPEGSWYVRELRAPGGYTADPAVREACVEAGAVCVLALQDVPAVCPLGTVLVKRGPEGQDQGVEGALYRLDHYPGAFATAEEAEASGITPRSWVLRTDAQGIAALDGAHLAEGGPFYEREGRNVLPLGTVILRETQAPAGYRLSEEVFVLPVAEDGTGEPFTCGYAPPEIREEAAMGGITVHKADAETGEPLSGCEFTLTGADGREGPVIVTDESGTASTGPRALPCGVWQVRETGAPEGYAVNGAWTGQAVIEADGTYADAGVCEDRPVRGGITVRKTDALLSSDSPMGDASFEGTVFEIRNASEQAVAVNGTEYAPGSAILRIRCGADGIAGTGDGVLPPGRYAVREVSVPEGSGYGVNADYEACVEVAGSGVFEAAPCPNTVCVLGGIRLEKTDADTGQAVPQGSASLAGAVYAVCNASANPVRTDSGIYAPGETVARLETDAQGRAETGLILPMGTYTVIEERPSEGYLLRDGWTAAVSVRRDGETVCVRCPETVIRGGVRVQKLDRDTGTNRGPGGIALSGAEITVISRCPYPVVFEGMTVPPYEGDFDPGRREAPGIVTRLCTDGEGAALTDGRGLPYGEYELYETGAPAGYCVNGDWMKRVLVRRDGETVLFDGADALTDELARADLRFVKEGVRGEQRVPLPGAVFRAVSLETGESHVLVTGPDGVFDSSQGALGAEANGNDLALGGDGSLKAELLSADRGVWFGSLAVPALSGEEGRPGAFPAGRYRIEELSCPATEGYVLCAPFEIEIHRTENGEPCFAGTVTNTAPVLRTRLLCAGTGTHAACAAEDTVLQDTVSYEGLRPGRTYELRGVLYDRGTGEPLRINGEEAGTRLEFAPDSSGGSVRTEFRLDASALAGRSAAACEYLYLNGREISRHDDPDDEEQTVRFPRLKSAARSPDGTGECLLLPEIVITDTVYAENLIPGQAMQIRGMLADGETGAILLGSGGAPVTAEAGLKPDGASASAELTFRLEGAALETDRIAVYEDLYAEDGKLLASHEDPQDPEQTVVIRRPVLRTELLAENGTHMAPAEKDCRLTDRVAYENLCPGREYELRARLADREGRTLTDPAGQAVTGSTVFVPDASSGEAEVRLEADASALAGRDAVCLEELWCGGVRLAGHEDTEDEAQSVHFPALSTEACGRNGGHVLEEEDGMLAITDTVAYENLIPGTPCRVSGTLHRRSDGGPVRDPETGEALTAQTDFIPEQSAGTVTVRFLADADAVQGQELVVFETLLSGGSPLARHEDAEDEKQTVYAPCRPRLFKYDASTGEGLAGAEFEVRDITGGQEETVVRTVSGEDGKAVFSALPGHRYLLRETKAPEGYLPGDREYRVQIREDGRAEGDLEIPNVRPGTVVVTKTDIVTGDPLPDCEICFRSAQGEELFRQRTDRFGRVYFQPDSPGAYAYRETAGCAGYYLDEEEYWFTVDGDLTVRGTVRFGNAPFGTAVIRKTDTAGQPLQGAGIGVFRQDGTFLGQSVTGEDGRVYFVSPGPGTYYFTELSAPEGYVRNTARQTFTVGPDYTITGTMRLANARQTPRSAATGDESGIGFWLAAAGAGLLGILAAHGAGRVRKKPEQE